MNIIERHNKHNSLMMSNLIANSIVYIVFGISLILELVFIIFLHVHNSILNLILILLIEMIILLKIVKIKRFKYGILFLQNKL